MCHCVICVVASTCMKQMKEEPNVGRQKAATKKQYSVVQMSVYNFTVALKKGTRGPLHGHSDCSCHRYIHCMVTVTVHVRYIHCMVTVTVRVTGTSIAWSQWLFVSGTSIAWSQWLFVSGTSIAWSQWLFMSQVHPLHGHSDCSCHRYIHCMVTVTVRVTGTSIAWSQWLFVSQVHPLLKTGGL